MTKTKFGGRPLGAKNKISEAMRESLSEVLQGEIDGLKERFESLYNIQRLELLVKFLPYVVPRLATEINITEQSLPEKFEFDVQVLDGNGTVTDTYKYKKQFKEN